MGLKFNVKNMKVMTTGTTVLELTMQMSKWWTASAFQAEPSTIKKQALKKYAADQQQVNQLRRPWGRYAMMSLYL